MSESLDIAIVDIPALEVARDYIRLWKEEAIDTQDHEKAATWRDEEKKLLVAIANFGFLETYRQR